MYQKEKGRVENETDRDRQGGKRKDHVSRGSKVSGRKRKVLGEASPIKSQP